MIVARSPGVADWAREQGISQHDGRRRGFELPAVDCILSIVNDLILSPDQIASARIGAFNCHNSLLPAYRGAFAANWALIDGQTRHGVTWHRITTEIDEGAIISSRSVPIFPDDDARALNRRCLEAGISLLENDILKMIESGIVPARTVTGGRYYPVKKRAPGLGLIDWSQSVVSAMMRFRALNRGQIDNSFDLPKLIVGNQLWAIGNATPRPEVKLPPGTICRRPAGDYLLGVADGALQIGSVQSVRWPGDSHVAIPSRATLPPHPLWPDAEKVGEKAASTENSVVRDFSDATRFIVPASAIEGRSAIDDWEEIADRISPALRGGGTIVLSSPGMRLAAKLATFAPLFREFRPIIVRPNSSKEQIATLLAQVDRDGPILADLVFRRRLTRAIPTLFKSMITVKLNCDRDWSFRLDRIC